MTIGTNIGKFVGSAAAIAVEGAKGAASYTGQFGRDVQQGVKDGYAERQAMYAKAREAQAAALRAKTEALPAPAPQVETAAA